MGYKCKMRRTQAITARPDANIAEGLGRLGNSYEQSRSCLAAKAVEPYLGEETQFLSLVQAGMDSADRGQRIAAE